MQVAMTYWTIFGESRTTTMLSHIILSFVFTLVMKRTGLSAHMRHNYGCCIFAETTRETSALLILISILRTIQHCTHPVLLLHDLVGVVLLVSDVDALQAVNVPREASFSNVRLSALDGLHERVVYEHVLLLRLHEVVPLPADVLQVGEDVGVAARSDLAHHGVERDVAAGAAYTSAEEEIKVHYYDRRGKLSFQTTDNITKSGLHETGNGRDY
jgi:hypothetical protein